MRANRTAVTLAAFIYASGAFAQSTSTTMDMGGGMTHVDTMGPNGAMSSSNCMKMGGGMTSCQTMDMSQPQRTNPAPDMSRPQANGTTLNFIGDLVARSRERSFERKLGQMLASGDCRGAATFALANGRSEASNQIRQSCQQREVANDVGGSPANSDVPFLTGNWFVRQCEQQIWKLACRTYVLGVDQGHYGGPKTYCIPEGVDSGQMYDVALSYLRSHPEHGHMSGVAQIVESWETSFPCR